MSQAGARGGPHPRTLNIAISAAHSAVLLRLLLLGITLLAFAIRASGLVRQSLWRDEVDALMFATRPLAQVIEMFRKPGENGPLFFLFLRPWLAAAGTSEFSLRFLSSLAATAAVPVVYVLVRRLVDHNRTPAVLATLLTAVAPYLVWYGQEAKMYGLLTLLVPVTLLLTVDAVQRGGWWRWALLYVLTTLSIYIHLVAALIVPVQVLWLLIVPLTEQQGRGISPARRWLWVIAYLAALFLPYVPLLRWQAEMWLGTFQTGHPFVPLDVIFRVILSVFSMGILASGNPLLLLPYMLGLEAGAILWPLQGKQGGRLDRNRMRVAVLLLIWFLLPPVMIYLVSLGMPIFTERYLIWSVPALFVLIALGVDALLRAWKPLGVLTAAAVLALNVYGIALQDRPIKADFRAAAEFVLMHRQPGDVLIFQIPYNRYTFTYYASPEHDPNDTALPWLDGPYTNRPMTDEQVNDWMVQGLSKARGAWLIASEVSMWDAKGLTEKWLAEHATAAEHAEFSRVAVTRYRFGPS
jgi:mannosyltransferase